MVFVLVVWVGVIGMAMLVVRVMVVALLFFSTLSVFEVCTGCANASFRWVWIGGEEARREGGREVQTDREASMQAGRERQPERASDLVHNVSRPNSVVFASAIDHEPYALACVHMFVFWSKPPYRCCSLSGPADCLSGVSVVIPRAKQHPSAGDSLYVRRSPTTGSHTEDVSDFHRPGTVVPSSP